MLNNRLELLSDYAFTKLNNLVAPISPRANLPPVIMSVGDPQHAPPDFVHEIISGRPDAWHSYPPVNGTPPFRAAAAGWLTRRYRLPKGFVDPETQIAPCAGTREGLFLAALLAVSPADDGTPNPFYQLYLGAGVMAGAEPRFMAASKETGFLPDLGALDPAMLARTRLMY